MTYNSTRYPTVFQTINGSRLYGIEMPTSDYDYMGACIEPPSAVIGGKVFEQHEWKGDSAEGVIYSLRKFVKLLIGGNPSVLCTIFSHNAMDDVGIMSDEFKSHMSISSAGPKFIGYAYSQLKKIKTQKGMHVTRQHLIDKFGYDTKYAGQVIRLCLQGMEYLDTGIITLPIPPDDAELIKDIRDGEYSFEEFQEIATLHMSLLEHKAQGIEIKEPDHEFFNDWLTKKYLESWYNNEFYVSTSGKILLVSDIVAFSEEAEKGYDLPTLSDQKIPAAGYGMEEF